MHNLGISLYPEHSTFEKDVAYMEAAATYGFTRIFTCLLSVQQDKESTIKEFTKFMKKAHELGFKVAVDTNPSVFQHLGATPLDLQVFANMGVDIIRLDGHFDDFLDSAITHNKQGILIEFNGSIDSTLEYLIRHGADKHNMTVCHNFYPQRYSGLSWNLFMELNHKWKSLGLSTAAFVTSNEPHTFGPWAVAAGLPTVEIHRTLPIATQVRHLLACELIDDIIIGNAYAGACELKEMASVDLSKTTIQIEVEKDITKQERDILFAYIHHGRQDASDFYIRSSMQKSDYNDISIPYRKSNKKTFTRGDIVVINDNLKHYRGECEVILKDIENDGERNYVGHIHQYDMLILDEMEKHPEHLFGFIE